MITKITGVKSREDFLKSPNSQEAFMDYLTNDYIDKLPSLRKDYPNVGDEVFMAMQHFLGLADTRKYLSTYQTNIRKGLTETQALAEAQKAVATKVPNSTVQDYLNKFLTAYNK